MVKFLYDFLNSIMTSTNLVNNVPHCDSPVATNHFINAPFVIGCYSCPRPTGAWFVCNVTVAAFELNCPSSNTSVTQGRFLVNIPQPITNFFCSYAFNNCEKFNYSFLLKTIV